MKKPLNERMEEAQLHELAPGFDKNTEWERLSAKLHPQKKQMSLPTWIRAAAMLLLFLASASTIWYLTNKNTTAESLSQAGTDPRNEWNNFNVPPIQSDNQATYSAMNENNRNITTTNINTNGLNSKEQLNSYKRTGEFVCNGTPCPIEICIIQTIKCQNERPSAIATCSIIEPDQAHQLHYKAAEAVGADCKVTVDEIRIRRINTGETIVLNASSKPSTAEELFNCLTGEIKCNLLAGVFHTDCNNQRKNNTLKIGNDNGNLVVE